MKHTYFFIFLLICFACSSQSNGKKNIKSNTNNQNMEQIKESSQPSEKEMIDLGMDVAQKTPVGLNVGDVAPMFSAKDKDGNTVTLESLINQGPVVLNFYRGVWCPVCNRYMSAFQDSVSLLEAKGAKVVSITPETTEGIEKFVDKTQTTNIVLEDKDDKIMMDYDVLFYVTEKYQEKIRTKLKTDIAEHNGQEAAQLPVPATFIIDQKGVITYKHFDVNYKKRASVKEILAQF